MSGSSLAEPIRRIKHTGRVFAHVAPRIISENRPGIRKIKSMRERKTGRRLDRRYQRALKRWTPEELEYLGTKYGLISDKAVCLHLQRSPNAILG